MIRIIYIFILFLLNIQQTFTQVNYPLAGSVTMPTYTRNTSTCPTGQGCCSSSIELGGVDLVITGLGTTFQTNITTDVNGEFSLDLAEGDYMIEPAFQTDGSHLNGVTTYDLVLLSRHHLQINPIICPFGRIAADVNNDAVLDSLDINISRQLILRITDQYTLVPNWRFVAKAYTSAHEYQADFKFVGDFWDIDYMDNQGNYYPFGTSYRDTNGRTYTYNGSDAKNLWVDILHQQTHEAPVPCKEVFWGFNGVKSGDINSSVILGGEKSSSNELTNLVYNYEFLNADASTVTGIIGLFPNKKYEIKISSVLQPNVFAYQLGLNLDTETLNASNLKTNEVLEGRIERDYALADAALRTVWLSPDMKNGLSMSERTELFSVEVEPTAPVTDLAALLSFDNQVLNNAFYTQDGVIDRGAIYITVKEIE